MVVYSRIGDVTGPGYGDVGAQSADSRNAADLPVEARPAADQIRNGQPVIFFSRGGA